ncbi:MAG: alpha-galactosidase [Puniceicoccaceae bacterium 5H]|nr:MAG: alpha-galactosidase [Puniceicoccaceae bacterium 5H]
MLALCPILSAGECAYDARIEGREILTPVAPAQPKITGARIFGVRPGKPIFFRVSATGENPVRFAAGGLPEGLALDPESGWITGRAPKETGDVEIALTALNGHGEDTRQLTLRVGDTIALTPPMGWNSWYVHSEGVSEAAIRETAIAMQEKGLADHGWTYLNIDDCWMGERDPQTLTIQPNEKFGDMKQLAAFVNEQGFKLGIYSTTWMSTYAGYIGGSAPNEEGDYSEYYLPADERQNPHQVFGRYPNGIRKGLARVGPVWLVDRDARQFAKWGIDYVKYDWKEWTLVEGEKGYWPDASKPQHKTLESGITQRVHHDFRALDRDIVISLSPNHDAYEDTFVPNYCNLWRLTGDIHAEWSRLIAPFEMEERLQLTRPGSYGDLDMLQIGPLGKPNRAEVQFSPSPLTPSEQYFQVTLWAILTQPLLLSCHIPSMDAFDLNLVTNDEVLAVNQDPLGKQGYCLTHEAGVWEIWAKDLADGSKAVAFFNLTEEDRVLELPPTQLGTSGTIRDLWRQQDIGSLESHFYIKVSPHGTALLRILPERP